MNNLIKKNDESAKVFEQRETTARIENWVAITFSDDILSKIIEGAKVKINSPFDEYQNSKPLIKLVEEEYGRKKIQIDYNFNYAALAGDYDVIEDKTLSIKATYEDSNHIKQSYENVRDYLLKGFLRANNLFEKKLRYSLDDCKINIINLLKEDNNS